MTSSFILYLKKNKDIKNYRLCNAAEASGHVCRYIFSFKCRIFAIKSIFHYMICSPPAIFQGEAAHNTFKEDVRDDGFTFMCQTIVKCG